MKSKKQIAIVAVVVLLAFYGGTKLIDTFADKSASISYQTYCGGCHGNDGLGLGELIPPLAKADWLGENINRLPCVIQNGLHEKIVVNNITYNQQMLGIEGLTDVEMHNIVNYVASGWGNDFGYYPNDTIQKWLTQCSN